MPRIDPYEQTTNVSGLPGTPQVSAAAPGAAALQSLGKSAELLSSASLRDQERDRLKAEREAETARKEMEQAANLQAVADAQDRITQSHLGLIEYGDNLKSQYTGNPEGYANAVAEEAKRQRDQIVKDTTNTKAKVWAQQHYASVAGTELRKAGEWQFLREKEYNGQQFTNTVQTSAQIVASDSSLYEPQLADLKTRADLARLGPGMTEKAKDAASHGLRIAATEGELVRNPARVLEATSAVLGLPATQGVTNQTAPDVLTKIAKDAQAAGQTEFVYTDYRTGAKDGATRTYKVAEVLAPTLSENDVAGRQLGKSGVPYIDALTPEEAVRYRNQALTAINSGNAVVKADVNRWLQDAEAMARDGKQHPNPLTPAQIATFGPDAERVLREVKRIETLGNDIASYGGKSKSEIVGSIAASEPAPGAGYATEDLRQTARKQAANQVIKAREDDAAAWVAKNTPIVQQSYATVFAPGAGGVPKWLDPTVPVVERRALMSAYATATLAEQQRLGIEKVSMLPDNVKAYIANGAQQAAGSGDRMANHVAQMAEIFGDNWQLAYKEVLQSTHAKQVPSSFIVIPGIPAANTAAREEVARLDPIKVEDLKKQTPKGTEKDVTEGIQSALSPWASSMMGNDTNTQTYNAVRATAEKLAYSRVIAGKSVGDAIKEATDTVIGHYEFPNDHSARPYAVPKTENPAQVRDGVDAVMKRLPALNLTTPPDMTKMRTPAEAQLEFVSAVQQRPLWVTNDKEDGLLLYTQGKDGRPVPVTGADGKQIDMKFDVLRGYALEEKAANAPTISPTGKYGAPGQVLNRYQTENERAAADARAFRERQGQK